MKNGNSLYYHSYITQSIDHVDERTSKYIQYRKEFLKKYCSPLQQKIEQLGKEISFYKHLIENQNQLIETEKQVLKLKNEISEFQQTQSYFLSHIDQYQKQIVELTIQNEVIQQRILKLKKILSKLTQQKTHQIYDELSFERKDQAEPRSIKSNKWSRIVMKSSIVSQTMSNNNSRMHPNDHKTGILLPKIFKVEKYYVDKETSKIFNKVEDDLKQKFNKDIPKVDIRGDSNTQQNHLHDNPLAGKKLVKHEHFERPKAQIQKKEILLKNKFKDCITTFNKFQILFKECFDKKKTQVQKSVSQLQSKLISDRQNFLKVCEAISQKDVKRIRFDQFEALTGEELMTLFISFPWIQKKIFKEIDLKRKLIVELQQNKFF